MSFFFKSSMFLIIFAGISCSTNHPKEDKLQKVIQIYSDSTEEIENNFVEPTPLSLKVKYKNFQEWITSIDSASKSYFSDAVYHFKLFTINSQPAIYVLESDNDYFEKSTRVKPIGDSYVLLPDDFKESVKNDLINDIGKELLRLSKTNKFKFFNAINRITVGFDETNMIIINLH